MNIPCHIIFRLETTGMLEFDLLKFIPCLLNEVYKIFISCPISVYTLIYCRVIYLINFNFSFWISMMYMLMKVFVELLCFIIVYLGYPSMLQTTWAASWLKPSLHTLPHWPVWKTSNRPSYGTDVPVKRTGLSTFP